MTDKCIKEVGQQLTDKWRNTSAVLNGGLKVSLYVMKSGTISVKVTQPASSIFKPLKVGFFCEASELSLDMLSDRINSILGNNVEGCGIRTVRKCHDETKRWLKSINGWKKKYEV